MSEHQTNHPHTSEPGQEPQAGNASQGGLPTSGTQGNRPAPEPQGPGSQQAPGQQNPGAQQGSENQQVPNDQPNHQDGMFPTFLGFPFGSDQGEGTDPARLGTGSEGSGPRKPNNRVGLIITLIVASAVFFMGMSLFNSTSSEKTDTLITSEFVQAVEQGRVINVVYDASEYTVTGEYYPAVTAGSSAAAGYNSAFEAVNAGAERIFGSNTQGLTTSELAEQSLGEQRKYTATYVGQDSLMQLLSGHPEVEYSVKLSSNWSSYLLSFLPTLLLIGLMIFFFSQMSKANNSQMSFGKVKAKKNTEERPDVRFDDVAGEDEAVEELKEIKDFLVNPEKYRALGAKIPRGCLLVGPPGTGKTLLAKAVAGEANVPFFSISGSEFVEMFVGVGASRVRSLFEQAKEAAPSIIFIDEIDAVGRQRGTGLGGGHDEREQTLNQLLVEMDGFDKNDAVVLIAATNRVDVLDPALLRPGRFDRQIVVDGPDVVGREKILQVHAKNKPIAEDVDLARIAKLTAGMTGADLMNLMNEAALLSARRDKPQITMAEVNEAMERMMAGPERKNRVLTEKVRRTIAYHESGHALVGHLMPHGDPVHKITIIPRGMALGYTMSIPEEDKFLVGRQEMIDDLAMFLGGRVAEEIFCDDITTGASNDLERATKKARQMVTNYGFSEALGTQTFGEPNHNVFLGRDMSNNPDYSQETAQRIDAEVARLMKEAHDTAYRILSENAEQMHLMASVLLERETVDGEACEALLDNRWEEYLAQEAQRIQAQAEAEAAVAGDAAADGIPAAEAGQADAATLADASPQVPAGKYCHACGAGIAADAVYCNHCGAKQED